MWRRLLETRVFWTTCKTAGIGDVCGNFRRDGGLDRRCAKTDRLYEVDGRKGSWLCVLLSFNREALPRPPRVCHVIVSKIEFWAEGISLGVVSCPARCWGNY